MEAQVGAAAGSTVAERIASAIENDALEVPVMPQVLTELLSLLQDPDASAGALSRLIHRDQMLTALVLRVASSPMYRGSSQVVSLQQAISRVGMQALADVVMASGIGAKLFAGAPGCEQLLRDMFRRSLASGLFAKEIARIGRKNVESAFLCGMLRDVGAPIVVQHAVAEAKRARVAPESLDFTALISAHCAPAGALLARRWKLPAAVCAVIALGDDYERASTNRYEAQVTSLAVQLARFALQPLSAGDGQPSAEAFDEAALRALPVIAQLNLYPNDVGTLLGKREAVLASVELLSA